MKIIKLIIQKDFVLNLFIFFLLSALITYLSNRLPESFYSVKGRLLRERPWENGGRIYQKLFKVKQWKKFLPELSDFVKSVFPKKEIKEFTKVYMKKYIFESCKSEMTHWGIIFSSLLFFFWCESGTAFLMITIAITLNLPYIIIQRYNRPRIMEFTGTMEGRHGRLPVLKV